MLRFINLSTNRYLSLHKRALSTVPAKITTGKYLAKRLVEAGVTHFFTVPGDYTLALLDELIAEPGLKMVGCCNEMSAGYAADGFCREGGGMGCLVGKYIVYSCIFSA